MATRYYLTKKSPGVMLSNESYIHDWDEDIGGPRLHKQRGWYTWEMSTSKTNGGRNTSYTVGELNDTAGYEIAFMRFTTPRLAAQTISGTLTLCVPTWGSDDASTTYYCVHAYSTGGDTNTVRDVILDHYVGAVNWDAGSLRDAMFLSPHLHPSVPRLLAFSG